jgi:hypothetical protein
MTKEDFVSWKNSPTTKEIFYKIRQNVERLQEDLGASAGVDPLNDRFKVGAIGAYSDLLNIDFEDNS